MIRNEREYKITKAQARRFTEAILEFDAHPPKNDAILVKAQRDSLLAQLEDLTDEIKDYEALKGSQQLLGLDELENLPTRLIQTRIAVGLSQKSLAAVQFDAMPLPIVETDGLDALRAGQRPRKADGGILSA